MRFAPAELAALERPAAGRPARLLVYFLGLLGPNGPLPLHLTEFARDRLRHASDPTFARFLDLFNHRMLSLLYRGWAQAQPAVSFDRRRRIASVSTSRASAAPGCPPSRIGMPCPTWPSATSRGT